MAECCHQLANFYEILQEDDFFMLKSKESAECLKQSLQRFVWLNEFYNDVVKFTLTPKCHFAIHLAEFARYQNPRSFWTYKQESFMGYISTLGRSCSHGTRACKLSESVLADLWPLGFLALYRYWFHCSVQVLTPWPRNYKWKSNCLAASWCLRV